MLSYFALTGRLEHTGTKDFPSSNTAKYTFTLETRRKRKSGETIIFELQGWNKNGENAAQHNGGEVIVEGFLGSWTTDKGYHIPQLIIQECRRMPVLEPGGGKGWHDDGKKKDDGDTRGNTAGDEDFDDDIPF